MSWSNRSIGSLQVSAIGMGGAHWSLWDDHDDAQSTAAINAGIDAGITLIDTAFRYTCTHEQQHNERLIAAALRAHGWSGNIHASEITVATKGGHFGQGPNGQVDGRPATIRQHAEASLTALGVDSIALYYLHWPDPKVPIAESMGEIELLRLEGKVQNVGVSNFNLEQLQQAMAVTPVSALQNKFNPSHQPEAEHQLIQFTNQRGIAYVPYSPLGGTFPPTTLNASSVALNNLAAESGISVAVLVLDWHLSLSPNLIPLVGSRRPQSLTDSARVLSGPVPNDVRVLAGAILSSSAA